MASKGLQVGGILISFDAMGGEDKSNQEPKLGGQSTDQRPGQCLPKNYLIPSMHIGFTKLRDWIQYMQYQALIRKFVGIKPSEKSLVWWINSSWKLKGHYDLQLGSKGFFTISFLKLEDRNRVLDGGSYLFYSVCLFLRHQKRKSSSWMKVVPVWIRLYSFPCEY